MKRRQLPLKREKGAVLILVAIAGAVLIGFLGIVIDLGRLFVTKTELQSAMDSCSLAAAAELKGDADAINRAISAGVTAGNRNNVGFQATAANITATDILFSDRLSDNSATYPFGYVSNATANPATAKYALCARSQGGITTWFMQVLEGFLGVPSTPKSVGAWASATLAPSQINCALPIGLCKLPTSPASNPLAGLTVGQWMTSKLTESATGSFDWIDFTPPGGGAKELANIIAGSGTCSLPPASNEVCDGTDNCVGEQGNKSSLGKAWNTRFGLYKGEYNAPPKPTPDFTGYAYTPTSWPSKFNAFSGTNGTVPNFRSARSSHLPYQGDSASGINLNGGYTNSTTADLQANGADRRLVTVPVVDCTAWAESNPQEVPVLAYACVLMLHPMSNDNGPAGGEEVWLEYRGASNDPASPCGTLGLGGGTAGPLVPVLVH